jgi:uncharacterized lipoprotein YmbA
MLVVLALSGCSSGGPPAELYVLGEAPPTGPGDVSRLRDPLVEVKPVRIPDYLERTDIPKSPAQLQRREGSDAT